MKLHLRLYDIHGTTLRVATLRPRTGARFATNFFHETWHIIAAPHDAAVIGALMFGLAFQRPGTLVLIDGDHLVPTPFDADPPDPILLIPAGVTPADVDTLRALKLKLRRERRAPMTINWRTPRDEVAEHHELAGLRSYERMSRRAGFICYTAPPAILVAEGAAIARIRSDGYYMLAGCDGEVQTIPDFATQVSVAKIARQAVVGDRPIATEDERWDVWREVSRRNSA
jgi:hypothetical protein